MFAHAYSSRKFTAKLTISKKQGRRSVGLTYKLYLTKLLHSAWGQTSLRSDILDMWCLHTCGRIMSSSENLPCLQWELSLLSRKVTINLLSNVMKC